MLPNFVQSSLPWCRLLTPLDPRPFADVTQSWFVFFSRHFYEQNMQQDVNKRRLGVLLEEVQRGDKQDDQARWIAALDGRTSGTTSGTSKGVRM